MLEYDRKQSVENLTYEIIENIPMEEGESNIKIVKYNDLITDLNNMERLQKYELDDYTALVSHYSINYTVKELTRITEYYSLSKRKKRKNELIEEIVMFEKDVSNIELVYKRKKLWDYLKEIKDDKYLSKFLILD
uniref:Uncharacterized protein n=1 Tax=viral metagenome TaxID=1070528 RepID=A0A6C0KDR7_9ZZZZ